MSTPGNKVLSKMLDRLLAGLMSGPNMNCRPHKSRQRVDLTQLAKLADVPPDQTLLALLGPEKSAKTLARVKPPKKNRTEEENPSPASKAWIEQSALLSKLRLIADDARTYENDTGVHALSIGFPLLSLPPGSFAGGPRNSTKRILAPIAFIPVTLSLKGGATPSIELACRSEGAERVVPNTALLSWIEQQTGKPQTPDAFDDEEGTDPWREITELVKHVADAMRIEAPVLENPKSDIRNPNEIPNPKSEGYVGAGDHKSDNLKSEIPNSEDFKADSFKSEIPKSEDFKPDNFKSENPKSENLKSENLKSEIPAADPAQPAQQTGASAPGREATAVDPPAPAAAEKPVGGTTMLHLIAAPAADDDTNEPAILVSAVLGLFPTAHQGLVRDTRAMLAETAPATGPIQNFLTAGIDFDAPIITTPLPGPQPGKLRILASERLAAAADPCQAKAVALARQAAGLVIHGPPGTGKSQTITNIIADHLARGQRVLLVCEKRTALDVVADRLEHMGLRSLCGIVHDPQRDQRELYRSIHEQLADLPEEKLHPRADSELQKVDAELQQLHDELTGFHQSLMQPPADGGPSFHELMGRWMSFRTESPVRVDDDAVAAITFNDLQSQQSALMELLSRAANVDYSKNPWTKCAGVSLADFLSRPMAAARTALDRIVTAADAADATADERIIPFNEIVPVQKQAAARDELAINFIAAIPHASSAGLGYMAAAEIASVRASMSQIQAVANELAIFRSGSLDQHLVSCAQPSIPQVRQDLARLHEFLEASRKWTSIFAFKIKSRAREVLNRFGLQRTPDDAARLHKFLKGWEARLVLMEFLDEDKPNDEHIERYFSAAAEWFPILQRIADDSALNGIGPVLAKLFKACGFVSPTREVQQFTRLNEAGSEVLPRAGSNDEQSGASEYLRTGVADPTQDFLDGLRLSTARADAIIRLDEQLAGSTLFDPHWLKDFSAAVRKGKLAHDTAAALAEHLDQLEGILRVRAGRAAISPTLAPVVDQILTQVAQPQAAIAAIEQKVLANEITRRLRDNPALQAIDGHRIQSGFDRFRELDQQKKKLVRDSITHRWISAQKSRLLASTGSRLNATGADLRRRLTTRGERAMRLRQVIAIGAAGDGGDPLFELRPVWMASPETVAQVFPRSAMFDVVIFDEASQCRLEEALPVLLRGRRVVIAGDPNQLPPTRFFETGLVQSEEEEAETDQQLFETQQGEVEDLLGAALNLSIQQCYLDVHYRSRNSDLIEFSNRNFYASRLQAIPGHPANRSEFSPLTLYRADGIYSKRRNEAEADQVVRIVRDLLKRVSPPSIGIACLNLPQRDLIMEKLDDLAAEDTDFAKRLAVARTRKGQGSFEGLFVKNLENVQGDERDDIIISTTYGPDAAGKFYRRFGPLGMTGGGRRLNVLVTRARNEVHLVTSIPPDSYRSLPAVPEGQSATGAWLLFAYLKYAEELAAGYTEARRTAVGRLSGSNANVERRSEEKQTHTNGEVGKEIANDQLPTHNVPIPNDGIDGTGELPPAPPPAVAVLETKSPSLFAEQLARSLASQPGIGSDVHWGNDGFCVDIALHHPDRHGDVTLGILCDGCRYTAAADPLEWDIFRTGILAGQGWQLLRIWTPHFFRDPQGNLQEISKAAQAFAASEKPVDALPTVGDHAL
jgi:hypothetical protein